jgi:heterodisulfide reductase subunit C
MDFPPRMLWRLLLLGETLEVLESRTFSLCSSCYTCTLRCPRNLPLTDVMADLKQVAALRQEAVDPAGEAFHHIFLEAIRVNGRIPETRLMAAYLFRMGLRNPAYPLAYATLGIRLMKHGKLSWKRSGHRSLEPIFQKIEAVRGAGKGPI